MPPTSLAARKHRENMRRKLGIRTNRTFAAETRYWLLGGTLAFPIDAHHSIKLYASSGVSARTDNNYNLFGIAWQYRWAPGF